MEVRRISHRLRPALLDTLGLPAALQQDIRTHGIRNSHLLSIAPTGTIGLMMSAMPTFLYVEHALHAIGEARTEVAGAPPLIALNKSDLAEPFARAWTRLEPYRIRARAEDYVLETLLRDEWRPLYVFTGQSRPLIDLQVGSWYVSTHPGSVFVVGLTAALVTADARMNLRGRNLAVHRPGGPSEQLRMDSAAEVLDVLADRYGLDLDGLAGLGERVAEVLDS